MNEKNYRRLSRASRMLKRSVQCLILLSTLAFQTIFAVGPHSMVLVLIQNPSESTHSTSAEHVASNHSAREDDVLPRQSLQKAGSQEMGVTESSASGKWVSVGPSTIQNCIYAGNLIYTGGLCSGRVTAIAVDASHPGTIYLGADGGGVWKSADSGLRWTPLADNQPSLSISTIALDPSGSLYAGTGSHGDGAGILKSIDGGQTWMQLGASTFGKSIIARVAVRPDNPSEIIAASHSGFSSDGVWVSSDGGNSWTRTLQPSAFSQGASDIVIDPIVPTTVYAAVDGTIYKSQDGGATWEGSLGIVPPANGYVGGIRLATSVSAHLTVLAAVQFCCQDDTKALLYRTENGGSSWSPVSTPINLCGGQCFHDMFVAVDPTNSTILYLGGFDLYRTNDGGNNWTDLGGYSGYLHPDQAAFAFNPASHDEVYIGNDGGIWRSQNASSCSPSSCWTNLNNGLGLTEFYLLSAHPTEENRYIGGTQDNGVVERFGTSQNWTNTLGGDGGWTAFDPKNPTTIYASIEAFSYFLPSRSDDGGLRWLSISNGLNTTDFHWYGPPAAIDPTTPTTLYLGTYRLYKTTNKGDNWYLPNPGLSLSSGGVWAPTTGTISAVVVAPSNGQYVYVGTSNGRFFVSTDGGIHFLERSAGLPAPGTVKKIAVDPSDPQKVFLTYSGFPANSTGRHVFFSSNAGTSWTDISANLPDSPANAIAVDSVGVIYVGTDIGVFISSNNGNSWGILGEALPRVRVTDLVFTASGKLLAATYGRGVWKFAGLMPHKAPIYFVGNQGFTAANGVTAGSGTGSDPYVIEGWYMNASSSSGLEIWNTDRFFVIRNVYVLSSLFGIVLANVTNGRVENSTVLRGVDLGGPDLVVEAGIYVSGSRNVVILGNNLSDNDYGMTISGSTNLTVSSNIASRNLGDGIFVGQYSNNTVIFGNTLSTNQYGMFVYRSTQVASHHNVFINNTVQAYDDGRNLWDNGYPSSGNYWSDYTGVDNCSGPARMCAPVRTALGTLPIS